MDTGTRPDVFGMGDAEAAYAVMADDGTDAQPLPPSSVVASSRSSAAPTLKLIMRLVAFDETGGERVLGEYTFHHTRSMPGPGAW